MVICKAHDILRNEAGPLSAAVKKGAGHVVLSPVPDEV